MSTADNKYGNLKKRLEFMEFCDTVQVGRLDNCNLHIFVNCYSKNDNKAYTVNVHTPGSNNKQISYYGFGEFNDVYDFIDILARNNIEGD